MKSTKVVLVVLTILVGVSLSCTFLKEKLVSGGKPATSFVRVASLPPIDPKAPLVSPGAVAIRRLAEIEPSVAVFAGDVETSERGAMKQTIAAIQAPRDGNDPKIDISLNPKPHVGDLHAAPFALAAPGTGRPVSALLMFQSGDTPLPGVMDGAIIGYITGMFKSMLSEVENGNYRKKISKTDTTEGSTSNMEFELAGSEDGSTSTELTINTESTKNGVKVSTELQAKIEGQDCPNAEGQLSITVKMHLSARSGGAGYTQDVTAFIRLVVGDDAEIATTTIDITQATSRGKSGQEVYIETGATIKYNGRDYKGAIQSNNHMVQKTDNANAGDINSAMESGNAAAYGAAFGAIHTAENTWQGGKCVKIEAASPGTVQMSSTHEIPVKVRHKKEGSELAAKLDAALTGEASIDPTLIAKTPGTLTYVAPAEPAKTATISLTANCRRGRAKLDLTANTGNKRYRVTGVSNGVSFTGEICNLANVFFLDAKFPGGIATTGFNADGSTNVDGEGSGCTMSGGGTYTLVFADDGSGTLKWTTSDKLTCPAGFSNSRTSSFTLTMQPAPDLSCP